MQQDKVIFFFQKQILEKLPEDIRDQVCVAGGAVRDKLIGAEIKDYDLFVQSKDVEDKLMKFLADEGKEGNVNSQVANYTFEGKWLQVIRGKYYDITTTEVIDSFDFTICCAMITSKGIRVHNEFYRSVATKHLLINRITFPLATLERMQKYIQKGYSACNGTLSLIARSLQTIDLNKPEENSLAFYSDGTPRFFGVD
jgi:hypothetical protein